MGMNYNQVQKKLGELNKMVYAMEQSVKAINRYENGTQYAKISIKILRREISELNAQIQNFEKSTVVMDYRYTSGSDKVKQALKDLIMPILTLIQVIVVILQMLK